MNRSMCGPLHKWEEKEGTDYWRLFREVDGTHVTEYGIYFVYLVSPMHPSAPDTQGLLGNSSLNR